MIEPSIYKINIITLSNFLYTIYTHYNAIELNIQICQVSKKFYLPVYLFIDSFNFLHIIYTL